MQLPRANDPLHTPSTDAGLSTDACMQPDALKNRLLQLCAVRLSIQHQLEAPVSPEQRGAYHFTSASTVKRQLAASVTALAACWTVHQLQVQDSAVSRRHPRSIWASTSRCAPAHATLDRHPSHCCACHFDIIRQTIVQHCAPLTLNSLAAACCVKLRLSLYFQIQT